MSYSRVPVITVDGPSGVGKGTLCQRLATHLGWALLDSGALYRLTALQALDQGVDLQDEQAVAACARHLPVCFQPGRAGEPTCILLHGEDVTRRVRSEECGRMASVVAALADVRAALLERQRDFRRGPGLVADGRDMGTVVFPDACCKIYLDASAEERARRRMLQLNADADSGKLLHLLKEIEDRDTRDSARAIAPLKPAEDAQVIDTTSLSAEEVFALVLRCWQNCQSDPA